MNVIVFTSDSHNWCLKPFSLLFNKYWSENQRVDIAGYTDPELDLPPNFKFYSIAKPQYNKARWADGAIKFLRSVEYTHSVILLEDYWLCRSVCTSDIDTLLDFCVYCGDNILRVDLTADRLYAGGCKDYGYWNKFDIVQAKGAPYELSLQAGLWNIKSLLSVLEDLETGYKSAWDVELKGTEIVIGRNMNIFGTRQYPMRYVNALNNAQGKKTNFLGLIQEDIDMIMPFVPEENR